jgi:glycosyltransferase involved in cell wall biosynthesis
LRNWDNALPLFLQQKRKQKIPPLQLISTEIPLVFTEAMDMGGKLAGVKQKAVHVKKVLIITYYWPPSGGAGVQRWLKFVKYLPSFSIDPIVLTVDPRYANYPQRDPSLEKEVPDGIRVYHTRSFEPLGLFTKIFDGYKVPYGGFSNVNRKSPFQTLMRFIRGNFFIPDARVGWNRYAVKKAREIIREHQIDTIITTGPPHSTHLVGLDLKRSLQVKWIADFRDPWTDIYYYSDLLHSRPVKLIDRKKERRVLETANKIITVNNSIRDLFIGKIKSPDKITVITNGFDEDDFLPAKPSKEFIITYSGTISENYKPWIFFSALSRITLQYPRVKFRFRLAGNLSPMVEEEIRAHGLSDIFDYRGYVDHDQLTGLLTESSALLYVFPETINYMGSSGKLFEYLATRKPIISLDTVGSDASVIISECEAGMTFSRDDEAGLFGYLSHLVEIFIRKGFVEAGNEQYLKYSRKNLASHLSRVIKS